MSDDPVVVVGAGLAGLACAVSLEDAGRSVVVLEASDGVGGRVRTDWVDGYLLDRGFQVMLTAYPEAHRQLDMGALDFRAFSPGARIQRGSSSSVIADPFRAPTKVLDSALSPAATIVDKLRLAVLRRRVRAVHASQLLRGRDISTEQALRDEGFSDRIIERFFRPLVGGIQLDPELTASRRMFDVVFRMLADGDSAVPAAGMQAIPQQLADRLPAGSVRLAAPVRAVRSGAVDTDDGTVVASAVVVACEGPTAAMLLGLPDVGSKSVGAVYFSAPEAPIDDKLVILNADRGPVLNAAVMSNVAPSYSPNGRHLVVAAMPGPSIADAAAIARRTFTEWWGPSVAAWDHLETYTIPHGQPTQEPPFAPKQSVRVAHGLYVCGDHRDTASIQGALYSGRRCAERLLLDAAVTSSG
ncbi:MAG: NAD(P)/FAD-dependent oxidoreductase [Ilumatobacteraceae bacterium]